MAVKKDYAGVDFTRGQLKAFGEFVARMPFSKMVVYGHSIPSGVGASDVDRDITTHLASMLNLVEIPRGVGGAALVFHNNFATNMDGGYAHVYQYEPRKTRLSTTLAAQATAGATTLTLAAGVFGLNDTISIGIGATGATGSEVRYVTAGGGTTTVTLDRALTRTHLNGEPVTQVGTDYVGQTPLYLLWYGHNDLGRYTASAQATALKARYQDTLRAVISRLRCSDIFENDNTSCVYSGGSTWNAPTTGVRYLNSGDGYRRADNTGGTATVTIHVPDNFPGGAVFLGFIAATIAAGSEPVWSFTVDGVAAGTMTVYNHYTGLFSGIGKRLAGLSAGRHTIVASLTTTGSGATYFDWWGIEATQPPLILVPGMHKLPQYASYTSGGWENQQRATTLTGLHGIGVASFAIASSTGMLPGQEVTFELGTGNEETLEILAVTDATHITTTTNSTKSHAGAVAVLAGIQDASMPRMTASIQAVCDEFDTPTTRRVVCVDVGTILGSRATDYAYYFKDGIHFNDLGNAVMVKAFYEAIMGASYGPTATANVASPSIPLPVVIPMLAAGVTAANTTWTAMPAALTEIFGATLGPGFRKRPDFSKVRMGRLMGRVRTVGFAGSSIRLRYSLDNGITWKYPGRDRAFAEDGTKMEVLLTSLGETDSGWILFPAEMLIENLLIGLWGINGNATAAPVLGAIDLHVR